MILDLTPMQSPEVSDGIATVGPGFRLGDLYATLARHEVTRVHSAEHHSMKQAMHG